MVNVEFREIPRRLPESTPPKFSDQYKEFLWCGTSSHRYFVTNKFVAEKTYQFLIHLEKMLLLDKGTNDLDRFSIG